MDVIYSDLEKAFDKITRIWYIRRNYYIRFGVLTC